MADFVWKIGGEAGFGIMGSGLLFGKVFTRTGYYAHIYAEYPSLIKGGHNTTLVRISDKHTAIPVLTNDLVVALNRFAVEAHAPHMSKQGGIIYDPKDVDDISKIEIPDGVQLYSVPLLELAQKAGGDMLMRNTVAMGASLALLGYPLDYFNEIIKEMFGRKGGEIVDININAAKNGYDYIMQNYDISKFPFKFSPKKGVARKLVMTGNEAISAGAIQAGVKFFAAYPMTPASSILHYMAAKELEHNIVVKHCEDEIAAMNMAIGAAFAGVRSMTSTSGGGFSLKVEAIGMAAMSETPVVVVLSQRTGPSTGMPTWTEQADLRFAIHASQGDFLRVVLAPGDIAEAYNLTQKAFNIAEKYQIPVIILSDKFLSESYSTVDRDELEVVPVERGKMITENMQPLPPQVKFKRYEFTQDGVSPRPIPGVVGGEHVSSSYEHWENTFSTEHFETRKKMVDKRASKIALLEEELGMPTQHGPSDAELTLVCWGSQKHVVFEAVDRLSADGVKVNALHFAYVHPIPQKAIETLRKARKLVIVENNSTAQFGGYLKEHAGVVFAGSILRYDGRQLFPENVYSGTKAILDGKEKDVRVADNEPVEFYTASFVK
ncbi:MAG: 2-oxoacid:acceptor oxidoreductase subunit alpha [Candidatus Micrarchaeia archaeon]